MANDTGALTGLRPLLSPHAIVALRGDDDFANLTSRWREWHAPNIAAVVEVATEEDVQQVVSVCQFIAFAQLSC
jgi:hypothetical protein